MNLFCGLNNINGQCKVVLFAWVANGYDLRGSGYAREVVHEFVYLNHNNEPICQRGWSPVCATDGYASIYFDNECDFKAYNIRKLFAYQMELTRTHMRHCFSHCAGIPCDPIYNPICGKHVGTNYLRSFPNSCQMIREMCTTGSQWQIVRNGPCSHPTKCSSLCTTDYYPVCAAYNGVERTFPNECSLKDCICKTGVDWTIIRRTSCEQTAPPCESAKTETDVCSLNYAPVCGSYNGQLKTFTNQCQLNMEMKNSTNAWQTVYEGECKIEAAYTPTTMTPPTFALKSSFANTTTAPTNVQQNREFIPAQDLETTTKNATEEPTSTTEEPTSTTEEITSTTKELTSTTEESTSTHEESPSTPESSTTEESTSTSEESTSTTEEITSTTKELTSTTEESTSTREESSSTPESSTTEESTSTSEESTSTTEEITSTTKELTSTTEESTSTREESPSTPESSTTEESTSTSEESTSTTEEITSTTKELTSTSEESTSTREESPSTPESSTPEESTSSPEISTTSQDDSTSTEESTTKSTAPPDSFREREARLTENLMASSTPPSSSTEDLDTTSAVDISSTDSPITTGKPLTPGNFASSNTTASITSESAKLATDRPITSSTRVYQIREVYTIPDTSLTSVATTTVAPCLPPTATPKPYEKKFYPQTQIGSPYYALPTHHPLPFYQQPYYPQLNYRFNYFGSPYGPYHYTGYPTSYSHAYIPETYRQPQTSQYDYILQRLAQLEANYKRSNLDGNTNQ